MVSEHWSSVWGVSLCRTSRGGTLCVWSAYISARHAKERAAAGYGSSTRHTGSG